MKTIIFAAAAMLAAVPAAAQTMPVVIKTGSADRVVSSADLSMQDRVEIAAAQACEKPFLRDLKAQELYASCLNEARAQANAILAERLGSPTELALR